MGGLKCVECFVLCAECLVFCEECGVLREYNAKKLSARKIHLNDAEHNAILNKRNSFNKVLKQDLQYQAALLSGKK